MKMSMEVLRSMRRRVPTSATTLAASTYVPFDCAAWARRGRIFQQTQYLCSTAVGTVATGVILWDKAPQQPAETAAGTQRQRSHSNAAEVWKRGPFHVRVEPR